MIIQNLFMKFMQRVYNIYNSVLMISFHILTTFIKFHDQL
jgi:hypothetical protein